MQIYLNLAGRDPADGGFTQVAGGRRGRDRGRRSRPRSWPSATRTTGPTTASPRAGRSSTAPSPRPRPATSRTGRARPPTWRTRPAPATSSCSPTRRTSSTPRRPGTLIAPSTFFGQHGYVPDVQDLAANVNMRATFLAGGEGIATGSVNGPHDRPRADARLPPRHPRAAAEPGQGAASRCSRAAAASSRSRSSASTTSTASSIRPRSPIDGIARRRSAARGQLATMFDEELGGAAPARA